MERWERERKREKEGGMEVEEERERGRDGGGSPGCEFPFPLLAWSFPWSPQTQVQWPLQKLSCLLLHLLSMGNII